MKYTVVSFLLHLVLVVLPATVAMQHATAAECPRNDLDARFCDQDDDLVADAPPREATTNPTRLIFAYTPVEDPAVYRDVWDGFLDHLAKATGKEIVFFPVQSNAAQIEAMRSGRLHVAGFNTGSTPLAVNCAGFVPFAMMAAADGSYGYEMEIITHPKSGIGAVSEIKGRTMAFSSPTSNSGFKAPTAILEGRFGLVPERDYEAAFTGKHDNTLLGVVNRDYEVGAMANSVKQRMISRQVIREADVRVLFRSRTFPTTAYGYVFDLTPALKASITEAFFTFPWEGSRLLEEYGESGEEQFVAITYKEYWEVIRQIDKVNQVSYQCR